MSYIIILKIKLNKNINQLRVWSGTFDMRKVSLSEMTVEFGLFGTENATLARIEPLFQALIRDRVVGEQEFVNNQLFAFLR